MHITVNGSIAQLLKGLPHMEHESIIGSPINDSIGNCIGTITITEINKDTDLRTGTVGMIIPSLQFYYMKGRY